MMQQLSALWGVENRSAIGLRTEGALARTVLYGINRSGAVQHTEVLRESNLDLLRAIAEAHLPSFARVEVWVESVRVVNLQGARN